MRKYGTIILVVAVTLVLVVALLAALSPAPATAQNTKCYMERGGLRWICGDGGTMVFKAGSTLDLQSGATVSLTGIITTNSTLNDLQVNGDAAITGSLTVDSNADVTGNLEVVDHLLTQAELYLIPPATQTVVNGGTITGTGGIVEVTAAGEVTATLVTASDGQVLILVNVGSNVINIVDTGTTKLSANAALGADDTLTLIGAGVTWYEISRSTN